MSTGRYTVHVPTQAISWRDARDACVGLGSQLAQVRSASDMTDLSASLGSGNSDRKFWIGASDSYGEGDWRWCDGSPVVYFVWGASQPLDAGNEDCVAVYRKKSGWSGGGEVAWKYEDTGCDFLLEGYMCSPLSPPLPPSSPLPPQPPPSSISTPPPALPGSTTRYFLSTLMTAPDPGPMRWATARDYCISLGLQLAIVRSAADEQVLDALLLAQPGRGGMFWIGGSTRVTEGGADTYKWADGSDVGGFGGYSNWRESWPRGSSKCIEVCAPSPTLPAAPHQQHASLLYVALACLLLTRLLLARLLLACLRSLTSIRGTTASPQTHRSLPTTTCGAMPIATAPEPSSAHCHRPRPRRPPYHHSPRRRLCRHGRQRLPDRRRRLPTRSRHPPSRPSTQTSLAPRLPSWLPSSAPLSA